VVGGDGVLVVVAGRGEPFPMGHAGGAVVAVGGPGVLGSPGRSPSSEIRAVAG
jgi:hypothetical protein